MTLLTRALLHTGVKKEKQNIVWNMIGSFCYAFASMILTFLVMRMIGDEEGGIFSFGFSTFGQQMFLLAYFGIRPFQVTDVEGEYSFGDYVHHRILTCAAALLCGVFYLLASFYLLPEKYSIYKISVIFLLVCYKVVDGFADVYESEFQRSGNLYLTGKSNTFRTLLTVGVFLLSLAAGKNLLLSCVLAVAAQIAGVLFFDVFVLRELHGVERRWSSRHMKAIFKSTSLLFISVFLDFYIFSASKYAIDTHMNDTYSGYFNIIFMPTSMINLVAGFVIRPFLTFLTGYWNQNQFDRFFKMLKKLAAMIGGLSVLAVGATWLIGRQVLEFLEYLLGSGYEGRLTGYHISFLLIVLGGSFYAFLNLFYYVLIILRRQKLIFVLYLLLTALALALTPSFVMHSGIAGAAMAYLLLMVVMAAAFVTAACVVSVKEKNKKDSVQPEKL